MLFIFQAERGIRWSVVSLGLKDVYKRREYRRRVSLEELAVRGKGVQVGHRVPNGVSVGDGFP